MPLHHLSIRAQQSVTLWRVPELDFDFIGTKTRRSFLAGMITEADVARPAEYVTPPLPPFDEQYFEWVDILESVEAAADSYVIIELGAGYGRWSMRAAVAARRRTGLQFHCVAVEAEPDHFRWMLDHFRDNEVAPDDHELIWAAVGAQPGFVPFWVGDADSWYGQAMASEAPVPLPTARRRRCLRARSALGRPPVASVNDKSIVWVPCVTLADVIAPYPFVDLIDIDIQGAEVDVLTAAIDRLNERVRRIHIGTHSTEIEERLRTLFHTHGWTNLNDYPCQQRAATPYGEIAFGDGVQTWLNRSPDKSQRLRVPAPAPAPRPVETEPVARETAGAQPVEASPVEPPPEVVTLSARVEELEQRVRVLKAENRHLRER